MNYKTQLQISCHCENIQLQFLTNKAIEDLPLRRCLCSFCTAHGNVYTSDNEGELLISYAQADKVNRYRNTRSVSGHIMYFLVCQVCGTVPLAVSEIDGEEYAVLSISGPCDPPLLPGIVTDMDYDDESLEVRNARRRSTWIPHIKLPDA